MTARLKQRLGPFWGLAPIIASGLLAMGLFLGIYNENLAKTEKLRDVTVQADILAGGVTAALAFDDSKVAQEYVNALGANRDVEAAGVYNLSGKLVAGYARPGAAVAAVASGNSVKTPSLEGNHITVSRPVVENTTVLGSVYLRTVREPLGRRAARYSGIGLLVIMAALMVMVLGAANTSLVEAHRKLKVEMEERERTEQALRRSREMEAAAQIEIATQRSQAALRQSERQLEFALDAGRMGSWELDLASGQVALSDYGRAIFGLPADTPCERHEDLMAQIHPDDRRAQQDAIEHAVATGSDLEVENRVLRRDGTVAWILMRGRAAYEKDRAVRVAGVCLDITERKRADEQREQFIEQLTASNEERTHFAHVASHDLREPLRLVTMFCGKLLKGYGEHLDDRAREYLSLSVKATTQMGDLLDDLVDFGRLGLEPERRSWFLADESLNQVLQNFRDVIRESGAEISQDTLPRVYGNRIRFHRLMQNLVGNALKYVAPGVTPRIHVSAAQDGEFWRFSVTDNGIGIAPRHHEQIFEPFKRLHTRGDYYGTGLGLAICRKIVEGFGGAISVCSAEGEGSTFSFTVRADGAVEPGNQPADS